MRWRRGDRGHHRTRAKLTAIAESIKGETNDARRNQPAGDAVTLKAMFVYGNPDSPPTRLMALKAALAAPLASLSLCVRIIKAGTGVTAAPPIPARLMARAMAAKLCQQKPKANAT